MNEPEEEEYKLKNRDWILILFIIFFYLALIVMDNLLG